MDAALIILTDNRLIEKQFTADGESVNLKIYGNPDSMSIILAINTRTT